MAATLAACACHGFPAPATPKAPKVVTSNELNSLKSAFEQAFKTNPHDLEHLDVNVQDQQGNTLVLRFLCKEDIPPQLFEELLTRGAAFNDKLEYPMYCGMTPLMIASGHSSNVASTFVSILLSHGADPSIQSKFDDEAARRRCFFPTKIKEYELHGKTALHIAAATGKLDCLELLLQHGAGINQVDASGNTALLDAARYASGGTVFSHLLEAAAQTEGVCCRWSDEIFAALVMKQPLAIITAYLNYFVQEEEEEEGPYIRKRLGFRQMYRIYGPSWKSIDQSPLHVCLSASSRRKELESLLTHPIFEYIITAKWQAFGRLVWMTELAMFVALVVATFIAFLTDDKELAIGCRMICLVLSSVFLVLEAKDGLDSLGRYLTSLTNWLNLVAYTGIIVVSVVTWSTPTEHSYIGAKAVVMVLLTFCCIEYLRIVRLTGLLIAMMTEMLTDVAKFLMLYMVFQIAFSGALFVIFRDNPDTETRFGTYSRAFVSTFFMLLGDFDAEMFLNSEGATGVVAKVLVMLYLLGAMVILLNILIAMMSTSYQQVADSARSMQNIARAELVLRMEALLPRFVRAKVYRSFIPTYVSHRASQDQEMHTGANATKAADANALLTSSLESFEAEFKYRDTVQVDQDEDLLNLRNWVHATPDLVLEPRELVQTQLLQLHTKLNKLQHEVQATAKQQRDVVHDTLSQMESKIQKLQDEVQSSLDGIGRLLHQVLATDKPNK